LSDATSPLQQARARLAEEGSALAAALAAALKTAGVVDPVVLAFCGEEATGLADLLQTGDVAPLLARDAAAVGTFVRAGKGIEPLVAMIRSGARCCTSLLGGLEDAARREVLLVLLESSQRRLEGLLRVEQEDWARRLAESQDQLAQAEERASTTARENERLQKAEARSRHRAEQLALLGAVTHRVAGILEPERLMQEAATAIQARMDHTFVAVVVLGGDGTLTGRWAGRPGVTRVSAGRTEGPIRGIIGRALRKRSPQVAPDVSRDPDYQADVAGTRSEMVVPLVAAGRVVGALDFQSETVDAFDLDDVVAAEILAEFLVVALRNAQLFSGRDAT